MGTNFYWFMDRLGPEDTVDRGLHIGKNSAGWVFHFQAHAYPLLKNVKQYEEFLKEGIIYDEYGEEYSYEEFWEVVRETLNSEDIPPYSFKNLPEEERHYSLNAQEWMNKGYMFTLGDFS